DTPRRLWRPPGGMAAVVAPPPYIYALARHATMAGELTRHRFGTMVAARRRHHDDDRAAGSVLRPRLERARRGRVDDVHDGRLRLRERGRIRDLRHTARGTHA